MSKRLKKALALIASCILWIVSSFPERGLAGASQLLDSAAAHPYRTIGAVVAAALAIYALWDWILDVLGIHTRKRLENEIRTWLDSFSFGVKREIVLECYFNFVVTPDFVPPFSIALPKDLDRYVMIGSRLRLSDKDKQIVDNMSVADREMFKAHLGLMLTRGRVTYTLDLADNDLMIQNRVPVTPDLTEHVFMTAVDELIIARAAALNGLTLLLGQARANQRRAAADAADAAEATPPVAQIPEAGSAET